MKNWKVVLFFVLLNTLLFLGIPFWMRSANSHPASKAAAPGSALEVTFAGFNRYSRTYDLSFNAPIDSKILAKHIVLNPALPFQILRESDSSICIEADFEAGTFYAVTLRGGAFKKDVKLGFIAPDKNPELEFISSGTFFPLHSAVRELPAVLLNTGKVSVQSYRAYPNRILDFLRNPDPANAREIAQFTLAPDSAPNTKTRFPIPLDQAGLGSEPGLFQLCLRGANYWENAARLVVLTDFAVVGARSENETVFSVHSISSGNPVEGATVELYSTKFQLLGTTRSDANGFGRLALPDLADAGDEPELLLVRHEKDTSFLRLSWLYQRAPSFRYALPVGMHGGYNAFVFAERGACRPGESIECFGMLRTAGSLLTAENVPLDFILRDDMGKIVARQTLSTEKTGFCRARFTLPSEARTGRYQAELCPKSETGKPYGTTAILVADYVPDQMKMELRTATAEVASGAPIALSGSVRYYFGTPLASGTVNITTQSREGTFAPNAAKGFRFGIPGTTPAGPVRETRVNTRADGSFDIRLENEPPAVAPSLPENIVLTASARPAGGGRAVSATLLTRAHHRAFYLGLKAEPENGTRRLFSLMALTPQEKPHALHMKLRYELTRSHWEYVLRESPDGRLQHHWQEQQIPISKGELALVSSGTGVYRFGLDLPRGGSYRLTVSDEAPLARLDFTHDSGAPGEHSTNPAVLALESDRIKYRPGEQALLRFTAPFAGEGILFGGSSELSEMRRFIVRAGQNEIPVPLPETILEGSYHAGLTVIAAPETKLERLPLRLFGTARFDLDQAVHKLNIALMAPAQARPGESATVRVSLTDAAEKAIGGRVLLWGEDEGILALTSFATPDPFAYFFGPTASPFAFGDTYGLFFPLIRIGSDRIGGGDAGGFLSPWNAAMEKAAVLPPEILDVPASGVLEHKIIMPEHVGALRLMALGANATRTGAADQTLTLRHPLTLTLNAPRAVAPGDRFQLSLEAFNHDLPEGSAVWTLEVNGQLHSEGEIRLEPGKSVPIPVELTAQPQPGATCIAATLKMGKNETRQTAEWIVRPAFPAHDFLETIALQPGETLERFAANPAVAAATGPVRLEISPPIPSLTGALEWLNLYPYGCLEQTVAAAFPFLSVKPLAAAGLIPAEFAETAETRIHAAIARLRTMERPGGGFSMWPAERAEWQEGSLFAWHFLLEAEASGIAPAKGDRPAIARSLRRHCTNAEIPSEQRAYAAYLLALAAPASAGPHIEQLLALGATDDFSRFLCGAALVRANRAAQGSAVLRPLLERSFWRMERTSVLDSDVRRLGFALWILDDVFPGDPAHPRLVKELEAHRNASGDWGSTQNNAWAALGLSRYAARHCKGDVRGRLRIEDSAETAFAGTRRAELVPASKFRVANDGQTPLLLQLRIRGVPHKAQSLRDGFTLSREYLNSAGQPVSRCRAGELIQVRIRLSADAPVEQIVLTDLLPGGLEIEDERLATRAARFEPPRERPGFFTRRLEKRFDRFLLFGDINNSAVAEIRYQARAVTRGKFTVPALQIEAMYRPLKTIAVDHTFFEIE